MKLKLSLNVIRNTLLILLTCLSYNMYAQSVSPNDRLYWLRYQTNIGTKYFTPMPVRYDKQASYIKERNIEQITTHKQEFNKKGKAKKVQRYRVMGFDTAGRPISLAGGKTGKPISWANKFYYNNFDFPYKSVALDGDGKVKQTNVHDYDTVGKIHFHYYEINKKGDTSLQCKRGRKDTVSLTSTDYYFKKGKLKYTWVNEYYPNKSKKQTIVYNKKRKQEYVWDFQCKEDGVELAKQKDTSTICSSKTYDADSTITEVYLSVDSRGVAYKEVYKRNKYGKTLEYSRSNEKEGWQINDSKYVFAADGKTMVGYSYRYYRKGIMTTEWDTTLDAAGNRIAQISNTYKKGVLESSTTETYEYDKHNRPVLRKVLLADGTPKEITNYKYN